MSTIPIIQGSAISDVYQKQQTDHYQTNNDERAVHATLVSDEERRSRREDTPKKFQDVFWAIAFIAHLIVMIVLIVNGLRSQNGIETNTYGPIVSVAGITGTFGIGASLCAFPFMMTNAIGLVKAALIFSLCTSLAMGIIGFMTGNILLGVLGLLSFAFGICYAKIVWVRIPFAAANLRTALTAVRSNLGVAVLALGFTALAFVWTILWFLGVGNALSSGNSAVIFLLVRMHYYMSLNLIQDLAYHLLFILFLICSSFRIIGYTKCFKIRCMSQLLVLLEHGGLFLKRPIVVVVLPSLIVFAEQRRIRLDLFASVVC
jgi:hypothetical protein